MLTIRIVNVRDLRTREQRAGVLYVGRPCAGWPGHPLANPFRVFDQRYEDMDTTPASRRQACLADYHDWLLAHPKRDELLAKVWEDCGHGAKPLGCWCCNATVQWTDIAAAGRGIVCHAQLIAREVLSLLARAKSCTLEAR